LLKQVPIIVTNKGSKVYDIEREITRLLNSKADPRIIEAEVMKLRKYSYHDYVQSSL